MSGGKEVEIRILSHHGLFTPWLKTVFYTIQFHKQQQLICAFGSMSVYLKYKKQSLESDIIEKKHR